MRPIPTGSFTAACCVVASLLAEYSCKYYLALDLWQVAHAHFVWSTYLFLFLSLDVKVKIQACTTRLAKAKVLAELSSSLSRDDVTALRKFSREDEGDGILRQEYLEVFKKCVRYIPCWVLECSQVAYFLPAKCLFERPHHH